MLPTEVAQEEFEPSASLVLSETGLPIACRAKFRGLESNQRPPRSERGVTTSSNCPGMCRKPDCQRVCDFPCFSQIRTRGRRRSRERCSREIPAYEAADRSGRRGGGAGVHCQNSIDQLASGVLPEMALLIFLAAAAPARLVASQCHADVADRRVQRQGRR
jgi:hypothetical protein